MTGARKQPHGGIEAAVTGKKPMPSWRKWSAARTSLARWSSSKWKDLAAENPMMNPEMTYERKMPVPLR